MEGPGSQRFHTPADDRTTAESLAFAAACEVPSRRFSRPTVNPNRHTPHIHSSFPGSQQGPVGDAVLRRRRSVPRLPGTSPVPIPSGLHPNRHATAWCGEKRCGEKKRSDLAGWTGQGGPVLGGLTVGCQAGGPSSGLPSRGGRGSNLFPGRL